MRLVPKPDKSTPLLEADGRTISQAWDEFFAYLFRRSQFGVLDMPDVDNSTPITSGQVLVYDGTAKKLKPGAN
ncbi:hypothetical protein JQ633_01055 [Bradyrhizobium tropiciagri]|uniref:hypothetical protein n=1 Tax=Bradyrhizobium tropiciagri TaxID=312253 RepID=UPI001BA93E56|nr:hypothetical protein [Bradyrhizobium tropiciagri]MBR0868929.1 hypothetical protein [Bradyrhizobium tropiciagri]